MKLSKFIIINVISVDTGTWRRIDGLSLARSIRKLVSPAKHHRENHTHGTTKTSTKIAGYK